MKSIWSFVAGIGAAVAIAWIAGRRASERVAEFAMVDLNSCSASALRALGLTEDEANSVIEGRPYRNKLDLVSQMIVPEASYAAIRNRISVSDRAANKGVQVAS